MHVEVGNLENDFSRHIKRGKTGVGTIRSLTQFAHDLGVDGSVLQYLKQCPATATGQR
jgi:hypothetical protein